MPPFNEKQYPGCTGCGLWKYSGRWRMHEETSPNYPAAGGGIMIVVDAPSSYDVDNNELMSTDWNGGHYLREYLEPLSVPWVIVSAVRCHPGIIKKTDPDVNSKGKNVGKERKPKVSQIRQCSPFLKEAFAEFKPKVVIGLGDIALQALFDPKVEEDCPTTIGQAYGEVYTEHKSGAIVMIGTHPRAHTSGNTNLDDDYRILFSRADDLANGVDTSPPVEYEYIENVEQLERLARIAPKKICGDFETKNHLKVREWKTIHHLGAKCLCLSISFFAKKHDQDPKNYLIPSYLFGYTKQLEDLFRNREFTAHNAKFDIQVAWRFLGICIEDLACRVNCTLTAFNVRDQAYIGNSLERRAMLHLNVGGWKGIVDYYLKGRNKEIAELHKPLKKKLKMYAEAYRNDPTPFNREALSMINEQIRSIPPEKSADFEAMPDEVRDLYCCTDTDRNIRLSRWIDENLAPLNPITEELTQRVIYVTLQIERNGLPASEKRIKKLRNAVRKEIRRQYATLLRFPEVQDALLMEEEFVRLLRLNRVDEELLQVYCSPKRSTFLNNLGKTTNVLDMVTLTDEGAYSFNRKTLEKISGGEEDTDPLQRMDTWTPHEEKSDSQLIWTLVYSIRKLFDLNSKFLKDLLEFTVNNRIHTNFKTCKVDLVRAQGSETSGGTGTGRLSSSDPSLMNLKKDPALRYVFTPVDDAELGPKWVFGEYDYDRIEPVCLTVVTGCKAWWTAISRGLDLYRYTANDMYPEDYGFDLTGKNKVVDAFLKKKIPESIRDVCKMCTLAVMYGMSKYALSAALRITTDKAQEYLDMFFTTLPEIAEWQKMIAGKLERHESIQSWFFRERFVHGLPPKNRKDYFKKYSSLRREFINWPIQSMASDICIWMVYECIKELKKAKLWWKYVRFSNIVHDSILPVMHRDAAPEVHDIMMRTMVDTSRLPFEFGLPLGVTPKFGEDMGLLEKLDKSPLAKELGITL